MINDRKVAALIPAAGMGVRMGSGIKKQFLSLEDMEILNWTLLKMWQSEIIDEIIVMAPSTDLEEVIVKISRWQQNAGSSTPTKVILGGESRQASVFEGLKSVSEGVHIVVIQDGVRPFVPVEQLEEMCLKLSACDGVVVALRSTDTLKQVDEKGVITGTIDRDKVWSVQTPQVFNYDKLLKAHELSHSQGFVATDDASLIEHMGGTVVVVESKKTNIKITTPFDLYIAKAILNGGSVK